MKVNISFTSGWELLPACFSREDKALLISFARRTSITNIIKICLIRIGLRWPPAAALVLFINTDQWKREQEDSK